MSKICSNENFEIIDCKGIDKLFGQIPIRLKQSDFDTLGIIIDADAEIKSRWGTLQSIFSKQDISLPDKIPNEGLILNENKIKLGVWIMPNNDLNGMLEDFISFLIPEGDRLLPVANQTLATIERGSLNQYNPAHRSKALIHSWLSWQEEPCTPMGLAITKKFLTTQGESCDRLISWLRSTFL